MWKALADIVSWAKNITNKYVSESALVPRRRAIPGFQYGSMGELQNHDFRPAIRSNYARVTPKLRSVMHLLHHLFYATIAHMLCRNHTIHVVTSIFRTCSCHSSKDYVFPKLLSVTLQFGMCYTAFLHILRQNYIGVTPLLSKCYAAIMHEWS